MPQHQSFLTSHILAPATSHVALTPLNRFATFGPWSPVTVHFFGQSNAANLEVILSKRTVSPSRLLVMESGSIVLLVAALGS